MKTALTSGIWGVEYSVSHRRHDGSGQVARLSVCAIVAQVVLILPLASLNAEEHRTVKMEVLAVKETEVCLGGYGSDECGTSNVLNEIDRLRSDYLLQTHELEIHPQDDVQTVKLKLTDDMIHALTPEFGAIPLDRRYAGLLILHLGGEFRSVIVRHCEDIDTRSPESASPPRYRKYDVEDDGRWYYHCRGRVFLPSTAAEWNIKLDDSAIVFTFVGPMGERS